MRWARRAAWHLMQKCTVHSVRGCCSGGDSTLCCRTLVAVPGQAEWLVQSGTPLARWSEPLLDPPPSYKGPPVDAVLAWHDVAYGQHAWALPR